MAMLTHDTLILKKFSLLRKFKRKTEKRRIGRMKLATGQSVQTTEHHLDFDKKT